MKTKKNLVKRALSLVLTLLMVLSLVPMSVFSAFAEELPELSATIDTGDSITLKDADTDGYYDISNADELYAFAAIVNGGNASINGELTADIVVNENVFNEDGTPKYNGDFREWTTIGDSSYGYSGIFDGQNHILSGLYILDLSIDYVGLFGCADNATVKNTGVIDSIIMGNGYVGGVCGQALASKVINCYNSGVVNGMNRIGGVVGDIVDSTITNCYNTGTVSGFNLVGGVSGNAYASKVIDCYNAGEVRGSSTVVGGVVGVTDGGGTITNCYNTGEVKGNRELVGGVVGHNYDSTITNCYNAGTVSAKVSVGGLVGYNTISGKVANCYNIGTVSGENKVGGMVGYNYEGTITNCYNTSAVSGNECVGGVVGENDGGTVTNCYNAGTVSSEDYAGGVVGENYGGGTITNCYNTGTVSSEDYVGGVVGYSNSDGTITNCYNTGEVKGNLELVGGVVGWNNATTITNCYYSDTTCEGGIEGSDVEGSAEAKTLDEFKSGEVAYLLQGEQTEVIWGQKIGTDEIPVLGGDKVYFGYTDCKAAEKTYANTQVYDEKPSHSWDNGVCTICNNACEHQWEDGVCTVCEKACEHEGSTNGFCADCGGFESAYYNEETGNYEIGNAGQLYWFADKVNNDNANFGSANAVITADIVVNEGVMDENSTGVRAWTPIGSESNPYTGTFDGNGKTVSGLYFNKGGASCVGLFGYVGTNGTVKNIGVINSYFNGYDYVGGVVGRNYIRATVTNCYNTGTVSGEQFVGGVVGQNVAGTTNDCYNTGTVSGSRYVGGVVGYNYESTIANCYNTGTVSGERDLGGVVGYNYESTINNCYNTSTVSGIDYIGGVVGYTEGATIKNCYNTGTVSASRFIGGVAGYNEGGTVTNCYYSETAAYGGINGKDITGSAEAKTTEQFESGEVAYLLGEAFGQKIGEDDTPVLGGDKVYFGYDTCDEDVDQVYSNEALSNERLSHVWNDGFCTVCDKACEHQWEDGVCTICGLACTHQWDAYYGTCVICSLECTHEEYTAEFEWNDPYGGECYVEMRLCCTNCGYNAAYFDGYGIITETVEAENCLNDGYEIYKITFEYNGKEYIDTEKVIIKSDNHVGEFENGFCSVCGGFEPAYFNEEEWVYEISNAGQLYWYAQKLNEENAEMSVVLTEDIVIPEDAPNWEPITASYVTFDGQFHTISGLNSVHEGYTYVGMFGNEVWWYEIKNLHITDSNFEGSDYVGGLVASMNNGGTVQNCYVTNTTVKGGNDTGTLVGFLGMSNVLNCYVDTDTLVGDFNGFGSIENSYYLAEDETEDGGKTLDQFKSGEVAYLLQSGIVGEPLVDEDGYYIYDEEGNLIYDTENVPLVWGQTIGEEDYPVFNGAKVYLSDEGYYNKLDKLAGYTIGLGDKIAVNYYMSLTEKTLSDENAKMVFTVPDTGSTYTVEIPVSEAVKSGNYYVFTCEVAAKEMTSVIEAKLVTSEGELQLEDYTVQQYAEVILSDKTKYAKEQELVKAMLNYGAYAQRYFNYNTESLANSILVEADRVLSDADLSNYEFALTDNDEIVSYYGSALSLETETAIKCYFIIEGDAEAVTATVNGEEAELKKNGTLYELKISDISAHQLNRMYEIKVGDLTLTYGVFSYGYTAMSSTKDALKNVVKAMYEYNQMAVAYKG